MRNVLLPVGAIGVALLLFGLIVSFSGVSPVEVWVLLFKGAFGDAFSWQNTLQRAAPLMLTALAVALPARAGLTVIGGEGALGRHHGRCNINCDRHIQHAHVNSQRLALQ